jgi:hypothetical protein
VYRRGGLPAVVRRGLGFGLRAVEGQTVDRTRFELPYQVRKQCAIANRYTRRLVEAGVGPDIKDAGLNEYKSSDTLFVLGSGSSINDITEPQWDHIDAHDSVGLNRWPVHSFQPTYHVFEIRMGPEHAAFRNTYLDLLEYRREAYRDIPIILKDAAAVHGSLRPHHLPDWLAGNLIISRDEGFRHIVGWDASADRNKELLAYLKSAGYFDTGSMKMLYRKRGSISYLIHLGVVLGYDNIVLCGVDMVDSDYFFDDQEALRDGDEVPIPRQDRTEREGDHRTNDPDVGSLTLEKVIHGLNDVVLGPSGVDLYVENDISALHPEIPRYDYER